MQSGDRQFVWTVQFWNVTARYYIYRTEGFCSCYAASGGSVELQYLSKLNKRRLKNTLKHKLLYKTETKPKIFLITLKLIPLRCRPQLHSLCNLPYKCRSLHSHTYANRVRNFYEYHAFDFLLNQMYKIHTPWFSYIHFNIILQILLNRLSLDIC